MNYYHDQTIYNKLYDDTENGTNVDLEMNEIALYSESDKIDKEQKEEKQNINNESEIKKSKIPYKKIGNSMWYIGHSISILSSIPVIIDRTHEATIYGFIIAAVGQIITMTSRIIERKG